MQRIMFAFAALACLGAFTAIDADATPGKTQARAAPLQISDSGAIIEPSRRMKFKDAPWDYEIRVALPASYQKSDKAYPVVWVTDGSIHFDAAVSIVNFASRMRELPEMIVVSVGVPREAADQFYSRRGYDFSLPGEQCRYSGPGKDLYDRHCKLPAAQSSSNALGGAPKFLEFLINDVRAVITREYRTADHHTLVGHSAGGRFCGYALLTHPESFDRYICGSPVFGELFALEEQYSKTHDDLKAKVFFAAGEAEILQGGIVSELGVVSGMARMAEILKTRNYPSLELHVQLFPDRVHGPVTEDNHLYWGLRTLFPPEKQSQE